MAGINNNLKQIRIEKGFTQEEIAEKIGLTRQAISAYESGKRQPGIDILMRLAEIYEVEIEDILYGSKPKQSGKNRIKIAAFIVAILFLILQSLSGAVSVASFILYPVEEGPITSDQMETVEKHNQLSNMSETAERISVAVLSFGMLLVLIMDLMEKHSFSWKEKVAFFLIFLAISWMIAILLGMIHPFFEIIDFVVRGPIHFTSVTGYLILDLMISYGKKKRYAAQKSER